MSQLPRLGWRLVAPSDITQPSTGTAVIASLKSQAQLCQYWRLLETPLTGTNSIILRPVSATATGSLANLNLVIAVHVTGSTAYRSPDTAAGIDLLVAGLCPDATQNSSGTFLGPDRDFPYDPPPGTGPRWSGYWKCGNCAVASSSYIIESQDNIFIGLKDGSISSGTMGVFAGAILEGWDSGSTENNFRLYGMAVGGRSTINISFWPSNTAWLSHNNVDGGEHTGIFIMSGGQPNNNFASCWQTLVHPAQPNNSLVAFSFDNANHTRQMGLPIYFWGGTTGQAAPFAAWGWARGLYMTNNEWGLIRVQSGGLDQAYKVSTRNVPDDPRNAFLFWPASGYLGP